MVYAIIHNRKRDETMAYSELIKNFNKVRDYMRDFYVYGFKSRDDYTKKSARSYDDEKRRIESWLGDYMKFHQTSDGKNVFLSIDSRVSRHNPLYKAWKTKSFTDGDIAGGEYRAAEEPVKGYDSAYKTENGKTEITNTINVGEFSVKKSVTGNNGDRSKLFTFVITLNDENGQPLTEIIVKHRIN